jgi:uncharacterized protein YabN with tetrapyrrole methylase and pyrophosphatase domain
MNREIEKVKRAICDAVDVMFLDNQNSEWSKAQSSEARRIFIAKEAQELLDTNEPDLLFAELNDVLSQALGLTMHYIDLGYDANFILGNRILHKYRHRKPHIFSDEYKTMQEELEYWQKAKDQEKNANAKSPF